MSRMHSPVFRGLAVVALLGAAVAAPSPAHAWWRGGFFFGFPAVFPLPYVYGPPVYAYPPPAYPPPAYPTPAYPPTAYSPPATAYGPAPQAAPGAAGQACYAGAYVCPLDEPSTSGSPCSCPTNHNGRAGGRVG